MREAGAFKNVCLVEVFVQVFCFMHFFFPDQGAQFGEFAAEEFFFWLGVSEGGVYFFEVSAGCFFLLFFFAYFSYKKLLEEVESVLLVVFC